MTDSKLEIKAGEDYRTRDGRKAEVVYIHPENIETNYPIIAYQEGYVLEYALDGKGSSDGERPLDLVAPWKDEPETVNVSEKMFYVDLKDNNFWLTSYKSEDSIARVTYKDWVKIQLGERDLIIGEGL